MQFKNPPWVDAVLHFWFEETNPDNWFSAPPSFDAEIRTRFGELLAALKPNPPDARSLGAHAHVAIVIVFDQFSRNIFRDSAGAYATDALALGYARHAVENALDALLTQSQRHFLYMPFMHSEDRLCQTHSLELFTKLGNSNVLNYARNHHDIVQRFGRFPHRNQVLGRASIPEELEFLKSSGQHT